MHGGCQPGVLDAFSISCIVLSLVKSMIHGFVFKAIVCHKDRALTCAVGHISLSPAAIHRNPAKEAGHFLQAHHPGHYKVGPNGDRVCACLPHRMCLGS
jgi:hypothetical protein